MKMEMFISLYYCCNIIQYSEGKKKAVQEKKVITIAVHRYAIAEVQ